MFGRQQKRQKANTNKPKPGASGKPPVASKKRLPENKDVTESAQQPQHRSGDVTNNSPLVITDDPANTAERNDNKADEDLETTDLTMERQNTKHTRFSDEKSKTEGSILRNNRENTMLERQNTKHARFSDERSKTEGDLALKSRPGTSLDGHKVDWVDCTDSADEDELMELGQMTQRGALTDRGAPSAPPFNANAVLKGDEPGNNIRTDGDNARKPTFAPGLTRDNIVVWPYGNGTITLPKPPPRQPRPPDQPKFQKLPDKWIRINIGGALFYTRMSTLSRCPGSRLTELVYNDNIPDDVEREYRFDRSPVMFAHILDYYRYGNLHIPQGVCVSSLKYELEFWRLPDSIIAPCCWETFSRPDDDNAIVKELDAYEVPQHVSTACCPTGDCRMKLWVMLEFPSSSWYARLWASLYALLVIASTLSLILDTVHSCRVAARDTSRINPNETNPKQIMLDTTNSHPAILVIEIVTSLVFSVDILLRFYSCSSYGEYGKDLLNWADIASVTAEWILLVLITSTQYWTDNTLLRLYKVCSFIRVLRVLRLFRLARTYKGLRVFLLAMSASVKELLLLAIILLVGVIIFATAIYYAEFDDPDNNFPDIPYSFWWAIVTMTTVGYGDIIPKTAGGYVVGAICAVMGMVATGLPIPIIATNFQMFYSYSKVKDRMRLRRRQEKRVESRAVTLPNMKTWDTIPTRESTCFEDDMTRQSTKTTFNNRAFSPSDSGVFDDNSEKVDHSDRPKGARQRPNHKNYSMLRNDSTASDAGQGPSGEGNPVDISRNATTLSTATTEPGLSRYSTTLPDIGSSSPRISNGSNRNSSLSRQASHFESNV